MNWWTTFFVGLVFGMVVLVILLGALDISPIHYADASKPALQAAGITTGTTASALKRALNPCVTSGQLPAGCEKYIKDGVVTQPPIKIVLDTSK